MSARARPHVRIAVRDIARTLLLAIGLIVGLAAPAAALTNTYQEGVTGTANSANIDTFARQDQPTTNFGTNVTNTVGVGNAANKIFHTWHEFNISDIPASSTITGCTLKVSASNIITPTAGHITKVCSQHWLDGDGQGEAQATWNVWKTVNNWTTAGGTSTAACGAGGDITTTNQVAYTPPTVNGTYSFPDMTALCQDALTNESGHLRIMLKQDSEVTVSNAFDYKTSDTSTSTSRPLLTVTFTLATTTTTSSTTSTSTSSSLPGNHPSLVYTLTGGIDNFPGQTKSVPFTCLMSGGQSCEVRLPIANGVPLRFIFPDSTHIQMQLPTLTICDAVAYTPVDASTNLPPAPTLNAIENCNYMARGATVATILPTSTLSIAHCWGPVTTFGVHWTAAATGACVTTTPTTSTTSTTAPYGADCATYGLTSSAIGPAYAPVLNCASISSCCTCVAGGNCTGSCSQNGVGWEAAIENAAPGDTFLLQDGTFTPVTNSRLDLLGGTSAANYVTIANDRGAAPLISGEVNFKANTLGYLRVQGLAVHDLGDQFVIHAERTSITALTDVRFDYMEILGGTDTAVKWCGNLHNIGISHSLIDGGRDHHGLKAQCSEAGSCAASPTHEPCSCDFAPDFYVTNNHITRETAYAYTLGEDNIQVEGWGDAEIWCNVFDRNLTGEDCMDLKGEGRISAVVQVNRNEADATTCRQNALIMHGNQTSIDTGRIWYNHFIGLPTDGVKCQTTASCNFQNNYFDNATLDLEERAGVNTCGADFPATALVAYNTWAGGRLRIGTGTVTTPAHCLPSLVLVDNIFSGTTFDQRDVSVCDTDGPIYTALSNNVNFSPVSGALRKCIASSRTCDSDSDCLGAGGGTCLSTTSSQPTVITTDPLLTTFHIAAGSPARDAATSAYVLDTDLDRDHRPQGTLFDIGADEFNIGPTTSTSTSSSTTTSVTFATTTTSTSTTSTSTSSTTSSTTSTTVVVVYQEGVSGPANTANIDTYARSDQPTTNFGTTTTATVGVGNTTGKIFHTWHQFDLSGIPSTATILFCELAIHAQNVVAPTVGHVIRVCGEHWLDGHGQGDIQATWNLWKTANTWGTAGGTSTSACNAGGDINTTSQVAYTAPVASGTYTFPSLVALCQDAVTSRGGQLRLEIKQDTESVTDNRFDYKLSETTTAANRPALTVSYAP